jgi:hypothetical protein
MFVFDNNVVTSLFGAVSIGASSITINKASAPFRDPPDPSGSVGIVTIVDSITAPTKIEIISYTGRTDNGATFTLTGVSKGQDGTTDQAWNNGDTVIQAVTAATVTELQTALDDKANTTGTYASLRAQATTKDDVGLGSVDNVSAASLRDRATHTGSQAISTITGLQTELNNKANAIGTYANLRAQATTKADVGLGSVDNVSAASLRDRSTHTGTQPASSISVTQNSLLIGGASNLGSTIASGAFGRTLIGAADAVSARTSLQLGSSALTGVKNSIEINTSDIQLVGDVASPGNSKYYGTDETGSKGFFGLPASGSSEEIGRVVYSYDDLTAPEYDDNYVATGQTYLQSEYPELFGVLGLGKGELPGDKLPNPADLPTGTGRGVAFSSDGTYMVVGHITTPFITIYKRSGDTFTKLANPSDLPTGTGNGVAFSTDDTYMAVAHATTPFITIYKRSGDTFTKLANPSDLPAGNSLSVAFGLDDTYMAVAHATSPFITIYKRSGDTFTKLANPSDLPANTGQGVSFSSDGTYMVVGHITTPFITIYKRSGDTFTKLANPSDLPANTGQGVAFSTDDIYMAVAHSTTPFINIYKRSGDTFTKLANPSDLPAGNSFSVAFGLDDTYMVVGHGTSPFITIYKRSGDTFTKLANPSSLPASNGNGVALSTNGTYMAVAHSTSPFITIYKADYFFDAATEFAVGSIDPITPDPIGSWTQGKLAIPYLRAK